MANIVTHNEKFYKMHSTKADNRPIGQVPVRVPTPTKSAAEQLEEVLDWISKGEYTAEQLLNDAFSGTSKAVRLQQQARTIAQGESFTDSIFTKYANKLTPEQLVAFAGDLNKLREYCRKQWSEETANEQYNDNYIFWELA